jgi:hypothetical protein
MRLQRIRRTLRHDNAAPSAAAAIVFFIFIIAT